MLKSRFTFWSSILITVSVLIIAFVVWFNIVKRETQLPLTKLPTLEESTPKNVIAQPSTQTEDVSIVAKNLDTPWSLAFTPSGDLIFTERAGSVRLIGKDGLVEKPLLQITDVTERGEGGLLGIALHPDFSKNNFLYVYYTFKANGKTLNRVVRFKKTDHQLVERKLIIDNITSSANHNGGRIKFGPDGFLYIGTGDAQDPSLAQNLSSTAGKILRLKDDGGIPENNPFGNSPVYSYGHRNVQGLAWNEKGQLWSTEHGPSANDELNLIEPGKNYGWPDLKGDQKKIGFIAPIINSGDSTWAPSGNFYYQGSILFSGLRGKSLFEAKIEGDSVTKLSRHFQDKFGRIRDVIIGPDGFIYIATSNKDGRGIPTADDDVIIRINPKILPQN